MSYEIDVPLVTCADMTPYVWLNVSVVVYDPVAMPDKLFDVPVVTPVSCWPFASNVEAVV